MLILAAVAALMIGMTTVILLSQCLPWPQRIHWLIATNALGCWGTPAQPITMREVFVVDVADRPDGLRVVVRVQGGTRGDETLFRSGSAPAATVQEVLRWRFAGTRLLLMSEPGNVSLHGPTSAVSNFRAFGPDQSASVRDLTSRTTVKRI
jgi:hypothetical protein